MTRKIKGGLVAGVVLAALVGGGAAIASGGGDDDGSERPITGSALDRASTAALDHTGGGRVSGSEVNDEEGAYEVEVTRSDGSQVDVHLDRGFNVLSDEADGSGDESGEN
jgi:uncharacterized membrane protein YkoI